MLRVTLFGALTVLASTCADAVTTTSLLGTGLSLRTLAQATSTSEPFVTSFPATAIVQADAVEFPDVESLFDPSTGVPPGFARSLVDVSIDAGQDFIEIDFDNSAPFNRFATGFQNTYIFTFASSVPVEILSAVVDEEVTTLGLDAGRVSFVGDELFVNVQSLPFNTSTFARILLTAEGGPGLDPDPTPGPDDPTTVIPLPATGVLLPVALAMFAFAGRLRRRI